MDTQQLQTREKHSPDVNDTEIAHLAGIFDIIGAITVNIAKDDDYKIGYNFQPVCRITYPVYENDPMMGKIMEYCSQNSVKYSLAEVSHGKGRDGTSNRMEIKRPEDIERFLEPLLPYLVSKYHPAMIMIEQILPGVKKSEHRDKSGFYKLIGYADKIRSANNQQNRMKYTQDYFAKEWSITQ